MDITFSFPASSDVAIPPGVRQRPESRLGQILELERRIRAAENKHGHEAPRVAETYSYHNTAFKDAWSDHLPLRIQVRRAADIEQAIAFVGAHGHPAYLVGVEDAALVAEDIRRSRLPVVVQGRRPLRDVCSTISDPTRTCLTLRFRPAASLIGVKFAIAGSFENPAGATPNGCDCRDPSRSERADRP